MVRSARRLVLAVAVVAVGCAGSRAKPEAAVRTNAIPIRFAIDLDHEVDGLCSELREEDGADDPVDVAIKLGVPLDVARDVREAKSCEEAKPLLRPVVEKRYRAVGADLAQAVKELELQWATLATPIMEAISAVVGAPSPYEEMRCSVFAFLRARKELASNRVAVGLDASPEGRHADLMFVLVYSRVSHLVRDRYPASGLDDKRAAAFSKVGTVMVLQDERLRPWLPGLFRGPGFQKDRQLRDIEAELRALRETHRDFGAFLAAAAPVLRRFDPSTGRVSPDPDAPAAKPGAFSVKFVLDPDYARRLLCTMLKGNDPAGFEARARTMEIPLEQARAIREGGDCSKSSPELDRLVDERHRTEAEALVAARRDYEAIWASIAHSFGEGVVAITGHAWFDPRYTVVVSAFHKGISNWSGSVVAAGYKLDPELRKRIPAHEMALSHVFQVLRERHPADEIDNWRVWAFAEIGAVLLLEDERLTSWMPVRRPGKYFAGGSYSQLEPLEAELRRLYASRRDFADFVDRSIPILKRFEQTHRKAE